MRPWIVVLAALSAGCAAPGMTDMVLRPGDVPAGYAYWPLDDGAWLRDTYNLSHNPGDGDPLAAADEGIVPTRLYMAAFARNGTDVLLSLAVRHATADDRDAWAASVAEGCTSGVRVAMRGDVVAVVVAVDDAVDAELDRAFQTLRERTGADDLCHPVKPWF